MKVSKKFALNLIPVIAAAMFGAGVATAVDDSAEVRVSLTLQDYVNIAYNNSGNDLVLSYEDTSHHDTANLCNGGTQSSPAGSAGAKYCGKAVFTANSNTDFTITLESKNSGNLREYVTVPTSYDDTEFSQGSSCLDASTCEIAVTYSMAFDSNGSGTIEGTDTPNTDGQISWAADSGQPIADQDIIEVHAVATLAETSANPVGTYYDYVKLTITAGAAE